MMAKQEKELQTTVDNYAKELEEAEVYADVSLYLFSIETFVKLLIFFFLSRFFTTKPSITTRSWLLCIKTLWKKPNIVPSLPK